MNETLNQMTGLLATLEKRAAELRSELRTNDRASVTSGATLASVDELRALLDAIDAVAQDPVA